MFFEEALVLLPDRLPDLYAAHREVWRLLRRPEAKRREFLFRVNVFEDAQSLVFLRAAQLPAHLRPRRLPMPEQGARLRFALDCNAVHRNDRQSYPVPEAQLPDWLAAQGERLGYALGDTQVRISVQPCRHPGHQHSVQVAHYQGDLTVTDATQFADTLLQGIGRHRGFGMGLLLVAPYEAEKH